MVFPRAARTAPHRPCAQAHGINGFRGFRGRSGACWSCGRGRPTRRPIRPRAPRRRRSSRSTRTPRRPPTRLRPKRRLFMVPWLCAASPNADRMTSTRRWLVSTLPPPTAGQRAGSGSPGGSSRVPGGMISVHGREESGVERDGFVQQAAQTVDGGAGDDGAVGVEVARVDGAAAGEIERGGAVGARRDGHADGACRRPW